MARTAARDARRRARHDRADAPAALAQSSSQSSPTRPAPTMETVRFIQRDSITCSLCVAGGNCSLHIFWTGLLGAVALLWILERSRLAAAFRRCPRSTISLRSQMRSALRFRFWSPARDEAEKLPGALDNISRARLSALRSGRRGRPLRRCAPARFCTPPPRRRFAAETPARRFPSSGWLGKPHALQQAYENSTGEWLVFTDADVHFRPDLLRRALAAAQQKAGSI